MRYNNKHTWADVYENKHTYKRFIERYMNKYDDILYVFVSVCTYSMIILTHAQTHTKSEH